MNKKNESSNYFCVVCRKIGTLTEIKKHQFNEHYSLVVALHGNRIDEVVELMKDDS